MTLPMTPDNLSTTMYDAWVKCRERGALVYIVGGWWTYPGCPFRERYAGTMPAPVWSVTRQTINALIKRGLITNFATPGGWLKRVEPVETADWAPKPATPEYLDGAKNLPE